MDKQQRASEIQIRKMALDELELIFSAEFSDIAGGLMAPLFAGLTELIKRGMFDRARVLVSSVTTPPPTITAERMEEVKALIISKIP